METESAQTTENKQPQHTYIKKALKILLGLAMFLLPLIIDAASWHRRSMYDIFRFIFFKHISCCFVLPQLYLGAVFYLLICLINLVAFLIQLHEQRLDSTYDAPQHIPTHPHLILKGCKIVFVVGMCLCSLAVVPSIIALNQKSIDLPKDTSDPYILIYDMDIDGTRIISGLTDEANKLTQYQTFCCHYWGTNEQFQTGLERYYMNQDVYQLYNSSMASFMLHAQMECSTRTPHMADYDIFSYDGLDEVYVNEQGTELFVRVGSTIYHIFWMTFDGNKPIPTTELCNAIRAKYS